MKRDFLENYFGLCNEFGEKICQRGPLASHEGRWRGHPLVVPPELVGPEGPSPEALWP